MRPGETVRPSCATIASMRTSLVITALLLVACENSKGSSGGSAAPSATVDPAATAPVAVASTPPTTEPTTEPSTPPAASASAPAATAAAAPGRDAGKAGAAAAAPALKPASKQFSGKNFNLDVTSPGCKVDTDCAMTIKLVAAGDYHVNKEYPYKFVATAAPGVTYLGKGDATTFSKAAGDFAEQGEKVATMTVRFKPTSAGEAKVAGTFKMSVCSAEQCQIESQAVDLAVPVL